MLDSQEGGSLLPANFRMGQRSSATRRVWRRDCNFAAAINNGPRVSRVARTRDRSAYADWQRATSACTPELAAGFRPDKFDELVEAPR
jgi:hypothetical protein